MYHLDLFSGIGGFALGLESTGHFKTRAFCEIEEFPRHILAKHWPTVRCYKDVRDVNASRLARDGIGRIDIITGGFPCQDISLAGKRAGLSGERSGLWSELYRVITEVRPRWAIIENVAGLRTLGADAVLADLAGADYAAWSLVVGAVHAGAPHRRQRVWVVAHAASLQPWRQQSTGDDPVRASSKVGPRECEKNRYATHADCDTLWQEQGRAESRWAGAFELGYDGETGDAADVDGSRLAQRQSQPGNSRQERKTLARSDEQWDWRRAPEPVLRGVDHGLPCGMDRRKRISALGNAVVPQIVAAIGRAIWTSHTFSGD